MNSSIATSYCGECSLLASFSNMGSDLFTSEKQTEKSVQHCVVPENIHNPPSDGQWKFLGGGRVKR